MAPARATTPLLVVFLDLTRFTAQTLRTDDAEVADTLDAHYERVGDAIRKAGGNLVKFIGDAALAVFPESAVDTGVTMLLDLKDEVDHAMAARNWECRLGVKAHFGPVVAGLFGERDAKRYDVIGKTVNTAAVLESRGVTLSAEAFRTLGSETRKRFKKHTPPISYIRAEDPRPFRRKGGS